MSEETTPGVEVAQRLQAEPSIGFVVSAAKDLQVTDDTGVGLAGDLLKDLREALAAIEEQRKELSLPLTRVARAINAQAKTVSAPLVEAESALRRRVNDFRTAQLADRARVEQEERERHQRAHVDPASLPQTTKTVSGGQSATSFREVIVHEVTNVHALVEWALKSTDPDVRAIVGVDTMALKAYVQAMGEAAVTAGIPGLEVQKRAQAVVR